MGLDDYLSNFNRQVFVEGDVVRVKLLRSNYELRFEMPDRVTIDGIKERSGEAYSVPIRVRLINVNSGKDVRGFDTRYINPYWLRRFVYDLAHAVAWMEREWDLMSDEYVEKVEEQYK